MTATSDTTAHPPNADALFAVVDKDPNWVSFHSSGHSREAVIVDPDADWQCPECGVPWGFVWIGFWSHPKLNLWAGIDTFSCQNNHTWREVSVPPVDIDKSGMRDFVR